MRNKKLYTLLIAATLFTAPIHAETTDECFEKTSRAIFKFNMVLDDFVIGPIAKGYNKLPEPIKNGTGNFTSNIATLLSIPNHLLQGNFKEAGEAGASFAINTTIGIAGLADPAGKLGLNSQQEDVGQTLGAYGIGTGCYFVLPVLGPTTVRDSFGLIADSFIDPFAQVTIREKELFGLSGNRYDYISNKGVTAVDFRADNDANFDSLEENSLDLYASFKSLYLQNRENKVNNSTENEDDWDIDN